MFSRKFYEIWGLVNAEWAKYIDFGLEMLKQAKCEKRLEIEKKANADFYL
jgi:hypothetical protein